MALYDLIFLVKLHNALLGSFAVAVVFPEVFSCSQMLALAPTGSQRLSEATLSVRLVVDLGGMVSL